MFIASVVNGIVMVMVFVVNSAISVSIVSMCTGVRNVVIDICVVTVIGGVSDSVLIL